MTTFWLTSSIFILLGFIIVWHTFFRQAKSSATASDSIRKDTNISLYHEHLKELEKDLAEGAIEQASFEMLKAELNKTLLQDIDNSTQQTTVPASNKAMSVFWPIGISIFIAAFSYYTYFKTGASEQLVQPKITAQADPHSNLTREQQALFKVQQLQQKVANEPTNSQAWFSLGQAFISVGQFDDAVQSFDQVIALIGEYAELIGPKAQALYYKNNQKMNTEIKALTDKALALDPNDASTNILLGMDAYGLGNFAVAIGHWEKVLASGRPGINTQALEGAISEAKSQLSMTGGELALSVNTKPAASIAPRMSINVTFSSAILDKLKLVDDKTVFVYATADGSRMPLAAVKILASDIPTKIILDDSLAMTDKKLSSAEKVNLYAVVSMSGGVGIKVGDYKGELNNVSVANKELINLTIDTEVKN